MTTFAPTPRLPRCDALPKGGILKKGISAHLLALQLPHHQDNEVDKKRRKLLRSRLADIADISPVSAPHKIPEEHGRLAAYDISLNPEERTGTTDGDWVKATRQLRRALVRQHAQQRAAQERSR